MKYCKICKVAGKDTDTVCAKGHPLSVFGAKPTGPAPVGTATKGPGGPGPGSGSGGAASATMFTLQGQLQQLEETRRRNLYFGRGLSLLSLLILLLIVTVLYQVYARAVLAYAVIENIRLVQDDIAENQISITFDVITPGQVVFDRRSGDRRTEKLDLITKTGPQSTVWAWPSDTKTGIDFSVVSRGGWFLTTKQEHFNVTRGELGVEVVFLMDITTSMDPYIQKLKRNCNQFAEQIRDQGIDCQLGLIAFGDINNNEEIQAFEPTADIEKFKEVVSNLELAGGGDIPESSVEAIEKALTLSYRPHTRVCFVHITDANCHNAERLPDIARQLKEKDIVTFVISNRLLKPLYNPICVNGGSFYGIRDDQFEEILSNVARSIASQIKSN